MSEAKRRGRPPKSNDEEARNESSTPTVNPEFVETLDKRLLQARWTKRELMSAIGLRDTQLYRWLRGDADIQKTVVNRIAIQLAKRLDEVWGSTKDPYPGTGAIDKLLNELLAAGGFTGSVTGRSYDECWDKIKEDKKWKVGYAAIPKWSERPDNENDPPRGTVINFTEKIGRLLDLDTEWLHLNFNEMPAAIRQQKIHCIAPMLLVSPGRLFHYNFSNRCGDENFTITAITDSRLANGVKILENLPKKEEVELLYVEGEIGELAARVLSEYRRKSLSTPEEAIAYIEGTINRGETIIPVLLIDSLTGELLIKREEVLDLLQIEIEAIKIETYRAFAVDPRERRLLEAINAAIPAIKIYKE